MLQSRLCRPTALGVALAVVVLVCAACSGSTVPVTASAVSGSSAAPSAMTEQPTSSTTPSPSPTPDPSTSAGPTMTVEQAGAAFSAAWCPTYVQAIRFQAAWERHVLDAPPEEPLAAVVRVTAGRAAQAVMDEVTALDAMDGQWPASVDAAIGEVIDHELGVLTFLESVHTAETVGEALAAQELAAIPSVANLHSDVPAAEDVREALGLPTSAISCDMVF